MPPNKSVKQSSKKRKGPEATKYDEPKNKKLDLKEDDFTDVEGDAKEPTKSEEANDKPYKTTSKPSKSINWLLSDEAFNLANPIPNDDPSSSSANEPKSRPSTSKLTYPHSPLTPLQNLISACILSKPLSHRLGLRTITTLFNPPFSLINLPALSEAGYEGRYKVMESARTQHREKTAHQLGDLIEGIMDICGGGQPSVGETDELSGLKSMVEGKDGKEARKIVEDQLKKIKGIGPGVVSIFLRRIQGDWKEVFPYVDDKGLKVASKLGLLKKDQGAEELADLVEKDQKKFVRLVDVLVGLGLEKKVEEAKEMMAR